MRRKYSEKELLKRAAELEKRVEELKRINKDACRKNKELETWQADAVIALEKMYSMLKTQHAKMAYYENPNTPPSKDSLAWKKEKKEKREKRKEQGVVHKKPRGKPEHKGKSRIHNPDRTVRCKLDSEKNCCGKPIRKGEKTRDIIESRVITEEARYIIENATCDKCGKEHEAENNLPENGSYGKNLLGAMRALREANITDDKLKPSAESRRCMEDGLSKMISKYRDSKEPHVQKRNKRLETSLPDLFTFLECEGVDPTNNAAERALRHPVGMRKVSGQIKGGDDSLRRKSEFMTSCMTWVAQGKNVIKKISAIM